jgi:hypothetical protein
MHRDNFTPFYERKLKIIIDDGEILSDMIDFIKIRPLIRELLREQKQRKDNVSACFRMNEESRIKPDLGK